MQTILEAKPIARRLLVISYYFPPDGSVGGLRWAGISKYLARSGWSVDVITAASGLDPLPPGVSIEQCRPHRTPNDLYNIFAAAIRDHKRAGTRSPNATPVARSSRTAARRFGVVGVIRQYLGEALAFPDYGQGWIIPAALQARAKLRTGRFDAIVTSGPPHSTHLAGVLACLGTGHRCWVDMRDPWFPWPRGMSRSAEEPPRANSPTAFLERFVLKRSRGVIANTSEFAATLAKHYPELAITCIRNGIDRERLPAPADKFDGLSIAYAGSLYLNRDLSPVVRAMREFLDESPEARECVKLRTAGGMEPDLEMRFRAEVKQCELDSLVEFRGRVAPAEAMDLLNRSHLALVLAQDQPTQVPAKLYECVAMGLPTLVIAEPESAAAREGARIGARVCAAADIAGIRDAIRDLWVGRRWDEALAVDIGYEKIAAEVDRLFSNSHGALASAR